MTLNDIGSIANLLAAIGVLITLIYLARQVKQGNILAKYQARQRMVEQAQEELYHWSTNPELRDSFVKTGSLSVIEQEQRTRVWWRTVGRIGFNAEFVAAVDEFLAKRPTTDYFERIRNFDAPVAPSQ